MVPQDHVREKTGTTDRAAIATILAEAALLAGAAIRAEQASGCVARAKPDLSPVTAADLAAQDAIAAHLARHFPGVPFVSEEAEPLPAPARLTGDFILVDPLDGTKEFLAGNGEFTVNIAWISGGVPVAGVVHAPADGRLWIGGGGAFAMTVPAGAPLSAARDRRVIKVRTAPAAPVACVSRSHGEPGAEAVLAAFPPGPRLKAGSALKFCLVAEGSADLYARCGPTMAWDTAAGQAVLESAGGALLDETGAAKRYGAPAKDWRNVAFVAVGDAGLREKAAAAIRRVMAGG